MTDDQLHKYFQSGCNLLSRAYPSTGRGKPSYSQQKNKTETISLNLVEGSESNLDEDNDANEEYIFSEKQPSIPTKQVLFRDAKFHPKLLNAVQNLQYVTLKQVQVDVLFYFTEYTRVCLNICAPRKCGKTTAVLLCILNEMLYDVEKKHNQALVLCPTLELAEMCYLYARELIKFSLLTICHAVKGKKFKSDKITENLIIATPDKALSLIKFFDFKKMHYLFIDDADCLKNPRSQFKIVAQIFQKMSAKCHIIVTSDFKNQIVDDFFKGYVELYDHVKLEQKTNYKNIKQLYLVHKNHDEKLNALVHFASTKLYPGQVVIFCENTAVVDELEELLQSKNLKAVKLFGRLPATKRNDVLEQFQYKEIKILITTPPFLRVIPTDYISKVINFEQLFDSEEGLLCDEYEKRKYLLNEKSAGAFVNFVDERYKKFFFQNKIKSEKGKFYYCNAEIITIEDLKNF